MLIVPAIFFVCTPAVVAESQREFQRGLDFYYAFDYETALSAFERASELDPDSSRPLWAIALALGPNLNDAMEARMKRAYETAVRAVDSARDEGARERAFAQSLLKRYTDEPEFDLDSLNEAYSRAMKNIYLRSPDDDDAAVRYAESWMLASSAGTDHAHAAWQPNEEVLAAVEGVLERNPRHPGANHTTFTCSNPRGLPSGHCPARGVSKR